jgi:hypothetical protein
MENALTVAPAVFVTVGATENVNGPAVVPVAVLLTVIVPVLVVTSAVPTLHPKVPPLLLHNGGAGAEIDSVAASTRKLMVGDPFGVTTVTVLRPLVPPDAAVGAMVNVAVTLVALTGTKFDTVTPVPDTVTDVAPVRPVPVRVTFTVAPRDADAGLMVVSVGPVTVNGWVPLVPPGVVTLTLCAVKPAVLVITKFAVICVALTTVTPPAVTPTPLMLIVVPVVVKLVPVRVTATVVPRAPVFGATEVRVGVGGVDTVKGTVFDVPFPVTVTLTLCTPLELEAGAMVKVAVAAVALVTTTLVAVTPVPLMLIVMPPTKPVPTRATG